MKTIGLVSQKGGVGKSTIAVHLAVAAGEDTVMIDVDPQRSTMSWHNRRNEDRGFPLAAEASQHTLSNVLREGRQAKFKYAIIDTPPHAGQAISTVLSKVDLVLVPMRPSIVDLDAIMTTIRAIQHYNTRAAIVLSSCPPKVNGYEAPIVREVRDVLKEYDIEVWPGQITQRACFMQSMMDGRAVTEFDPQGKASQEITELWRWVESKIEEEN